MNTNATRYHPQVLRDGSGRPVIVFRKGRRLYHAVAAQDNAITLVTLDTLRGYVPLTRKGEDYPARRAASYWLNHDFRPISKRAAQVLRALVARKGKTAMAEAT